ncbi:MAG: HlyD family secretion protein [Sulfurovum sp.]|nr:HlyD family secretion protein [Sulfurovum sp.]
MGWLLMLLYNAFCMVLFKAFKIPLTRWTLSTAGLGGVFIIGTLLFLMNFQHPYSPVSREYFTTTPIIPDVKGRVISIDVKPNIALKKGDVLFKIDPVPFQYKVDSLNAQLKSLEIDLDRTKELVRRKAGNQKDLDAIYAKVGDIQGKLGNAKFDLENTIVRAGDDGFVSQLFINVGNYVVSTPLRPAMVFINQSSFTYVAWFRQNNLARLKEGSYAEIAFNAIPGEVFAAEVKTVVPVLSEGEFQTSGNLQDMSTKMTGGRIPVVLTITDPAFEEYTKTLPGGAFGQAAVYSEEGKQVAFLRKILIRMSSWMNYLFPFR